MDKIFKFIIGAFIFILLNFFVANASSALATDIKFSEYLMSTITLVHEVQKIETFSLSFKGYILVLILSALISIIYLLGQKVFEVLRGNEKEINESESKLKEDTTDKHLKDMKANFQIESRKLLSEVIELKIIGVQLYKYKVETKEELVEVVVSYKEQVVGSGQKLSTKNNTFHFDRKLFLDLKENYTSNSLDTFLENNISKLEEKSYTPSRNLELGIFYLMRVAKSLLNNKSYLTDSKYKMWLKNIDDNGKIEGAVHNHLSTKPYVFNNGDESREYVCFQHPVKEFSSSYLIIIAFENHPQLKSEIIDKSESFREKLSF